MNQSEPHFYNIDAEQNILGTILICDESRYLIAEIVQPKHFYHHAHRIIFETMLLMGDRIDGVLLSDALRASGKLDAIGGHPYVADLMNSVATAANVEEYARIVLELAQKRELYTKLRRGLADMQEPNCNAADHASKLAHQLLGILDDGRADTGAWLAAIAEEKITPELRKAEEGVGNIAGISTGLYNLDQKTAGMHPGEYTVLAGRPGMGKTALAVTIGRLVAERTKRPALFFSLESSREQIARNILSAIAGYSQHKARLGQIRPEEISRAYEAVKATRDIPMYIYDNGRAKPRDIRLFCRRMIGQHPDLALIMIDYVQLMDAPDELTRAKQNVIVSAISKEMKQIAKETNIHVLALAQLNREVENRTGKRPRLSDIKESGSLEQDADTVILLFRPGYYDSTLGAAKTEAIIAKQRNGPTGVAQLRFRPEYLCFEDWTDEGQASTGQGWHTNAAGKPYYGAPPAPSPKSSTLSPEPDPNDEFDFDPPSGEEPRF